MVKLDISKLCFIAKHKSSGKTFEPIFRYDPAAAKLSAGRKVLITDREGGLYLDNDTVDLFMYLKDEDVPAEIPAQEAKPASRRRCQVILNREREAYFTPEILVHAESCSLVDDQVQFYDANRKIVAVFSRSLFIGAVWEDA